MRVLHLASGREWRGGQRQTWLLARGLADRGVNQRLITRKDSELARRTAGSGVPVTPVDWGAGLDPRVLPSLVREARRADLIHAHDSHAVALASAASRFTGRPFVATRRMTRALRRLGTWTRASRVIAISRAVQRGLIDSGVSESVISLITPAIDVTDAQATRPFDWRTIPGIPEGAFIAVAVSALTPEKGLDLLIEAMAADALSNLGVHCVIAGDGRGRDKLVARASALGALARVHFLGHVPDPLPLIASAGVLVMPSREEAFGSTILDALAVGVPVIGADTGGIPEALAFGGGVTFPSGNSAALAAEVHGIAVDPTRREAMSRTASLAARHFDLPGMVEATLGVYRSAMERVEGQ